MTHPTDPDGVDTELFDFDEVPSVPPGNACINYERCGNVVPHNGQMCGECLDGRRYEGRGVAL